MCMSCNKGGKKPVSGGKAGGGKYISSTPKSTQTSNANGKPKIKFGSRGR